MQHRDTPATASSDPHATVSHSEELVSADDFRRYMSALKASERERQKSKDVAEEVARKEYVDALRAPVEINETHVQRALGRFREAASHGESRVLIYRFPVELCTDDGRAINNAEEGWETTLTGVPLSIYEAWRTHLRDKGFHLSAEVIEFHGRDRIPRDAGLFIFW